MYYAVTGAAGSSSGVTRYRALAFTETIGKEQSCTTL
jgi:hypothetical protein